MESPRPTRLEYGIILSVFLVLLFSIWSGRQLFLDGASYVVQPMTDTLWYPHPTPRRFFAIMWSSMGPRMLGLFAPDAIACGAALFGTAVYILILLPVFAICRSRLEDGLRFALLSIFLSGTLLLANWPVGELLFAFALTTIVTLYTLCPEDDPKGWKRLIAALLLIASYETVALTNIVLAIGVLLLGQDGRSRGMRWLTLALLCIAPPFQFGFYLADAWPSGGGVLSVFVVKLAALLGGQLLLCLLAIYFFQHWRPITLVLVAAALALPVLALVMGEGLYIRTRLFQYSYPTRVYTYGLSLVVAMLPLLVAFRSWSLPRRMIEGLAGSLRSLSMVMAATFVGIGFLSSVDAYRYRTALEGKLSQLSGMLNVSACDLCIDPQRFGLADLGYPWVWPVYSMAYTMKRQDRPAVILAFPQLLDTVGDISREDVEEFYERQVTQRQGSDG